MKISGLLLSLNPVNPNFPPGQNFVLSKMVAAYTVITDAMLRWFHIVQGNLLEMVLSSKCSAGRRNQTLRDYVV